MCLCLSSVSDNYLVSSASSTVLIKFFTDSSGCAAPPRTESKGPGLEKGKPNTGQESPPRDRLLSRLCFWTDVTLALRMVLRASRATSLSTILIFSYSIRKGSASSFEKKVRGFSSCSVQSKLQEKQQRVFIVPPEINRMKLHRQSRYFHFSLLLSFSSFSHWSLKSDSAIRHTLW